jgi:methylenetetrahydrofolate reductase (NADPH)
VQDYGVQFGIKQTKDLIEHGFNFIHYYTMNLETSILQIIDGNGTVKKQRNLPFVVPTCGDRSSEDVRPIFWKNNSKSYI